MRDSSPPAHTTPETLPPKVPCFDRGRATINPASRDEQTSREKTIMTTAVPTSVSSADITPAEARAIAKEAYIYGYPMVDSYRILHAYFVNRESPEFKAPWNQLTNTPRVYTPDDKA